FRMCLEGRTNIDPKKYLEPGEIGYFPEGTPYGPQQDTEENLTLVLQFGGASGSGFMSRAQVRRAQSELTKIGTFEGGVFHRTSGEGRKNQDGFEALWEHVMGRKVHYPARALTPRSTCGPKTLPGSRPTRRACRSRRSAHSPSGRRGSTWCRSRRAA